MSEPTINLRSAHDSGPGNLPPTRVVVHATCPNIGYPSASAPGTALGTAHYFQTAGAAGSAHYVCDGGDEQHCVPDDVVAWHAPPNTHSIGIEICSEGGDYAKSYTRDQWLSDAVWPGVLRAGARARELCQRFGIPMVRLSSADLLAGKHGVCGHVDVSKAFGQSTHSDPGPEFPWPEFMAAITQSTTQGSDVNLTDRLPNLYTGDPADTLTLADTWAWATAHAANGRDRATEARDAARAVGLAMGRMTGTVADLQTQITALNTKLDAVIAALKKP